MPTVACCNRYPGEADISNLQTCPIATFPQVQGAYQSVQGFNKSNSHGTNADYNELYRIAREWLTEEVLTFLGNKEDLYIGKTERKLVKRLREHHPKKKVHKMYVVGELREGNNEDWQMTILLHKMEDVVYTLVKERIPSAKAALGGPGAAKEKGWFIYAVYNEPPSSAEQEL